MGKIDCTNVVNFFSEWERRNKIEQRIFVFPPFDCVEKYVERLQKWSDEHPRKTRKDKFFDVFAKNKLNICGSDCPACLKDATCEDCKKWWDEAVK